MHWKDKREKQLESELVDKNEKMKIHAEELEKLKSGIYRQNDNMRMADGQARENANLQADIAQVKGMNA